MSDNQNCFIEMINQIDLIPPGDLHDLTLLGGVASDSNYCLLFIMLPLNHILNIGLIYFF